MTIHQVYLVNQWKKSSVISNSIIQLLEAYGYKIKYQHTGGCSTISPEHADEESERFMNDKSNIIMEFINLENKAIPISINDWENLKCNFKNFFEFELFKLKNKCDK